MIRRQTGRCQSPRHFARPFLGPRDRLRVTIVLEFLILDRHRFDILDGDAEIMRTSSDSGIEGVQMAANPPGAKPNSPRDDSTTSFLPCRIGWIGNSPRDRSNENVRPIRETWSIHAFNVEGMP